MAKKPPLDDLEFAIGYKAMQAYARSKLANIWFVREQANRWAQTGNPAITINAVHPGIVGTRFFRGNGFFGWFWRTLLDRVAITPAQGAQGLLRLATDPSLAAVTGKYFSQITEKEPAPLAKDAFLAQKVWQASDKRWREVTA
jgi:NAD(P)-dependent dehydrogenase (short-subunit alcohol dehydrogenase family)